ncbi:MAG: response regulator [Acidobacteria bacterium]|nr:response regulator [Acidobacteriota bacterium]
MSKRKLLLADDSITIQKVVNLTFADEGIEVISVGDGDSAMHKFSEFMPDLVMADVNMPGLNGYEVCQIIKQNEETQKIPVILLVGSFEPFDEAEAHRVGADDFLTKPFQSIRQLVNKVNELLSRNSRPVETPVAEPAETTAPPPVSSFADTLEFEKQADSAPEYGDAGMDDEMIETSPASDYVPAAETHYQAETTIDYAKTQPLSAEDLKGFNIVSTPDEVHPSTAAPVAFDAPEPTAETEDAATEAPSAFEPETAAESAVATTTAPPFESFEEPVADEAPAAGFVDEPASEAAAPFAGESFEEPEAAETPAVAEAEFSPAAESPAETVSETTSESYYSTVTGEFSRPTETYDYHAPPAAETTPETAEAGERFDAPETAETDVEAETPAFSTGLAEESAPEDYRPVVDHAAAEEAPEAAPETLESAPATFDGAPETFETAPETLESAPEEPTAETAAFEEAPAAFEEAPASFEEAPAAVTDEIAAEAEAAPAEASAPEEAEASTAEAPAETEAAVEEASAPAFADTTPEETVPAPAAEIASASVAPVSFDDGDLLELPPLVEETGIRPAAPVQPLAAEPAAPAETAAAPEETAETAPVEAAETAPPATETPAAPAFPPELIEAIAQRVAEKISDKAIKDIAWEVVPQMTELIIKKMAEENLKTEDQ